jgi:hypothetical protein
MIVVPSSLQTSMQVVLPPYRTVRGPGDGMEPRTPQNVNFMRDPEC